MRPTLPAVLPFLLLVGCLAPSVDPSPLPAGAPAAGPAEPIAFDGRTERLACVVTPVERICRVEQGSVDLELAPGPVGRIVATFTWTPTGPVDAELQAYLLATNESGEWQWASSPDTFARGPPPLAVDWDATTLPFAYHHLSLHLATAHRATAGDARAVAGTGVAWRVEGEVTRP